LTAGGGGGGDGEFLDCGFGQAYIGGVIREVGSVGFGKNKVVKIRCDPDGSTGVAGRKKKS